MKKILSLSLMIILSVSVAFSQFGIKAGISIATAGGDDNKLTLDPADINVALTGQPIMVLEPKSRIGFVAGITYKINLLLGLSIQPEVLYIQKGAIYETPTMPLDVITPGLSGSAKLTNKLDYIEIPVMVKYALPSPVVSPYLEAGLSYGILLSAKADTEVTLSGIPGAQPPVFPEADMKEFMNKSDLSLQFGIGVSMLFAEIDARYVLGLSKLDKDGKLKLYNRAIVLTAGIRLP